MFHPGLPHTAAASRRSPCAAATPKGASDLAKRMECASLLALSKSNTALGDLLPHPYLPGPFHHPTRFLACPRTLPSRGPGSTPGPMVTMRWRARFHPGQGTPWKPSLPLHERRVPARSPPAPHSLALPVPPQPKSHSGGKPPQSMRCRDPEGRLRTRGAFGVRQLAGAFEAAHCCRGPTAPFLLSPNNRTFWGPDHTDRWRHPFHPGPGLGVPEQAASA